MPSHQTCPPTAKDILRYRSHHGVNLGSIFVLEKWLFPNMFDASVAGDSEHDAVISSINNIGLEATRSKWQAHWSKALTESDLNYLSTVAHCTTIRLPVGYFTLGPTFCTNTPFAMGPSQVYINAWSAVGNLVHRCHAHGIGVLLDLHACPGGANMEAHSGTSSGQAELWGNQFNLSLAKRCLTFLAQEVKNRGLEGVVGIQICNEAIYDAPGMYEFYDDVIKVISTIDSTIPIYISDGWDLTRALDYCMRKNTTRSTASSGRSAPARNPVVVDTHRYYTFSAHDTSRSPEQIIEQISSSSELSELDAKQANVSDNHGAVGVFVGEWSCTLAPSTWAQVPEAQREGLVKQYADVQARKWRDKGPGAGGSAFWTFKMAWGGSKGGEWGFREQVDTGAVAAPRWLGLTCGDVRSRLQAAEKRRQGLMVAAMDAHAEYWRRTAGPEAYFEHWRFGAGWHLGWCDARGFFAARGDGVLPGAGGADEGEDGDTVLVGADRIGFLDLWILKRMRDEGLPDKDAKGAGHGWEWEHGFRRGVADFERSVDAMG